MFEPIKRKIKDSALGISVLEHFYYRKAIERFKVFYINPVSKRKSYNKRLDNQAFIYIISRLSDDSAGLCDRLNSMVNMYESTLQLDVNYKIAHLYPFDIYNYLRPNEVDWRIREDQIIYDRRLVQVNDVLMQSYLYHWLAKKALNVARKKGKLQVHIYGNPCHIVLEPEKFSKLFHELFKPCDELQKLIDWNKSQIGGEYISATTRFQNLLGDFYEGEKYKTLETEEEKQDYIARCIAQIEEIHKKHPDKKILVTSDSMRFLNEAKLLPYVYVNPGKLVHLAYTENSDYDLHMKSFVDLYTIADAQKVYFLNTGKMLRKSSFAQTAAMINQREYEMVEF